jgi:MFS family permease
VAAWIALGKEGPLEPSVVSAAAEPQIAYARLLTARTFIGCIVATFGAYWALSLGVTWFTTFIVEALGFSQQQAGLISVTPWVFGACVVLLTGWMSQWLMMCGLSSRNARGVLGAAPLLAGGVILLALPTLENPTAQIVALVIGSGLCGAIYVVCPPMIAEFTPTSQRGAAIAIYGALYTLSGIIAPWVMGNVIQHAASPMQGYLTGYCINGAVMMAAGLLGLLLLWPDTERARLLTARDQPVLGLREPA